MFNIIRTRASRYSLDHCICLLLPWSTLCCAHAVAPRNRVRYRCGMLIIASGYSRTTARLEVYVPFSVDDAHNSRSRESRKHVPVWIKHPLTITKHDHVDAKKAGDRKAPTGRGDGCKKWKSAEKAVVIVPPHESIEGGYATTPENVLLHWVTFDGNRRHCTTLDNVRRQSTTFYNIERHSTTIYDIRRHSTTFYNIR